MSRVFALFDRFSSGLLAADKIGHPLVFEPEGGPSDEALAWNLMTWGQYQFPLRFASITESGRYLVPFGRYSRESHLEIALESVECLIFG